MDPTEKYQRAVPFTLLPVSHPLAALHVHRFASLQSSPDRPRVSDCCKKCGTYQFNGNARIRTVKLNRSQKKSGRIVQRLCSACGYSNDVVLMPPSRLHSPTRQNFIDPKTLAPPTFSQDTFPAPTGQLAANTSEPTTASKSRPKKKSALQDLLLKHRSTKGQQSGQSNRQDNSKLLGFLLGL